MKLPILTLLLAFIATPASADIYRKCINMVSDTPEKAYEAAVEWRDFGGGIPAEHCMALAMANRGQYEQAAELLEDLASRAEREHESENATSPAAQRADLLAQAGNAWLVAGQVDRAYSVLSDALSEPDLPDNIRAELLIDRSRTEAEQDDFKAALDDLNQAHALLGPRIDILTYRAAAYRALGALTKARADVNAALEVDPQDYEALFERASLNLLAGNPDGAIADWTKVKVLAPGTPAAEAAEINIGIAREARSNADTDFKFDDSLAEETPPVATAPEEKIDDTPLPADEGVQEEAPLPARIVAPAIEPRQVFNPFPTEAVEPQGQRVQRVQRPVPTPPARQNPPPEEDAAETAPQSAPSTPLF